MRAALYGGMYNFNHGINTIILPQGQDVAKILQLPRHLNMKNPVPGQPKHCTKHPEYDKKVKEKLKDIIESYKQAIKETENEPCKERVDVELDIDKLDKLSSDCYKTIIKFGRDRNPDLKANDPKQGLGMAGKSLDQIEKIGK